MITGAGSGIGRALSEALAWRGCQVAVSDIDGASAEKVADDIRTRGGQAIAVEVDVRDAEAVARLMNDVRAQTGRLDYVFNNAGIAIAGGVDNMTLDDWQRTLDIDLRGVVHGVVAAYPIMVAQGFGHIVNTASLAGLVPVPTLTAYAAAKHGVVGLSVSLRHEARPHGVRVSAVCPGVVDTPMKTESELRGLRREAVRARLEGVGVPVDKCAQAILRGVDRNRPIILIGRDAHLFHQLYRLKPRLYNFIMDTGIMRLLERFRI